MPSHTLAERVRRREEEEEGQGQEETKESLTNEMEEDGEQNPVEFLIGMVQDFINNPESVTTESLQELLEGLQELREEESPMMPTDKMNEHKGEKPPDLLIAIGRRMNEQNAKSRNVD